MAFNLVRRVVTFRVPLLLILVQWVCGKQSIPSLLPDVCELPADRGNCSDNTSRWYYQSQNQRCYHLSYTGCGGNENNFNTEQECVWRCSTLPGTTKFWPPDSNVVPNATNVRTPLSSFAPSILKPIPASAVIRVKRQGEDFNVNQLCAQRRPYDEYFRATTEGDCRYGYRCDRSEVDGIVRLSSVRCPSGLVFDVDMQACEWEENVKNCHRQEKLRVPAGQPAVTIRPTTTRPWRPATPAAPPTRPPTSRPPQNACRPSVSRVRGGAQVCAGQTIFEDSFDNLFEDVWQVEQYIPIYHPEYPFVSYQRLQEQPTVSTSNGFLRIRPTLQQNLRGFNQESIYSGLLDLFSGCTAPAEACRFSASGADILPPVVSGRVTSKSFAFTYGTVHVRARLPKGDWLYPELLLEPFLKKYGSQNFASGVLKIATARGNAELSNGHSDYSNKVLYGGPIIDFECRNRLMKQKSLPGGRRWGDEFHVYSLRWEPERITMSVDGVEWARVEPAPNGLAGQLPGSCKQVPRELLAVGSKMAPFDDHFYLTFGVAAGGVTEFPPGSITSDNRPRPWSNNNPKAKLNFWQDIEAWVQTWSQPDLLVDYVKVVAL